LATSFLDTSALVKRYVGETGTAWVQALTDPLIGGQIYIARITLVETVSAITRREKSGHLAPADATTALHDFRQDFAGQYRVIEISPRLIEHAADLARLHGLRGYDALQLAAVMEVARLVPSLVLVSADGDLNSAASMEGLKVEDPNAYP
jgi:predicted nucleic acid-binding protein